MTAYKLTLIAETADFNDVIAALKSVEALEYFEIKKIDEKEDTKKKSEVKYEGKPKGFKV